MGGQEKQDINEGGGRGGSEALIGGGRRREGTMRCWKGECVQRGAIATARNTAREGRFFGALGEEKKKSRLRKG